MFFLFAFLRTSLPDPNADEALLQAIAHKQSTALGLLYDRYGKLVFSLAYHIVYDEAVAEEVTQDVFLAVFRKLDTFQQRSSLKTWIYRIAVNCAINHSKKAARERAR